MNAAFFSDFSCFVREESGRWFGLAKYHAVWKVQIQIAPHLIMLLPKRLYQVIVDPVRVQKHVVMTNLLNFKIKISIFQFFVCFSRLFWRVSALGGWSPRRCRKYCTLRPIGSGVSQ